MRVGNGDTLADKQASLSGGPRATYRLQSHAGITVLENQEIALRFDDGAFSLQYYGLPLPIAPKTYPSVLRRALPVLESDLKLDDLRLLELQSIVAAFDRLGEPGIDQAERLREQFL